MKRKKEEIWSANPSKCTFLLIIFFGGRPINFEVKILATDNNSYKTEFCVVKKKILIENLENNLSIPLEKKNDFTKETLVEYFRKKVENFIKQISTINSGLNGNYNKNTFKDPLNEIFEMKNNKNTQNVNLSNLNNNCTNLNKKLN